MRVVDALDTLAGAALFAGLTRAQLEELTPAVRQRVYARGSYVFHEGDPGTAFYAIRSGQVKIARLSRTGEEAVFAILVAGDTFGELALFDEAALRTADAQATELTECVTVERAAFLSFVNQHPAVIRHLVQVLSRYIREMDESFSETAFLDIPGRVAKKLVELASTRGVQTTEGTRIPIRLTQRTLAGMVAASRENVNRALARLSARGDILQESGYITVVRMAELRRRAETL